MKVLLKPKLAWQLLLVVVLSFALSTVTFLLAAKLVSNYLLRGDRLFTPAFINSYNLLMLLIFVASTAMFMAIFLALINRKINYIAYITHEVGQIAGGDLGRALEIKGQDEIAQLCHSVNQLSQQLKQQFEQERQQEAAKNELITNISHDLRSPLTSIIGYIELAKANYDPNYIEIIAKKAYELRGLIDQLFEYTRLASPDLKLARERVDVGAVVSQLVGEYTPIFAEAGLAIEQDIEAQLVEIDVEQMVRVLINLLTNALKYSVRPSTVQVKVAAVGQKVKLSIANQVEQAPADLERMFERFYKGSEAGTGLGLAIARRIVDLHGGKIWAEAEGTLLVFNLLL